MPDGFAQPLTLPIRRTHPFDPPAFYADLREYEPVKRVMLASGAFVWLVTRHADVRAALKDPALSSNPRRAGFPDAETDDRPLLLIELDPPEHTVLRRMLAGAFSQSRLAVLRDKIQADADRLVSAMLAKGCAADLVPDYAYPIPLLTICHLLGVPYADHAFFRTAVEASTSLDETHKAAAFMEIHAYLDALVAKKEAEPGDDLIGQLVVEQMRPGHLDHETLVNLAVILLMAGFETTAATIALGVATLFHFPAQRTIFQADPGVTDSAVEEVLRFHSLGDSDALRVAITGTQIGGQAIAAGEGVIPLLWSANRDPKAFRQPDLFDIRRAAQAQLAFGFGIHQCIGLNLARMETRIAMRTLFDRIPSLQPAMPVEQMPFRYDSEIFGLQALPVEW